MGARGGTTTVSSLLGGGRRGVAVGGGFLRISICPFLCDFLGAQLLSCRIGLGGEQWGASNATDAWTADGKPGPCGRE